MNTSGSAVSNGRYVVVGGPTVVFDFGGLRFISDPTFDPPTDYGMLRKTEGPAVSPEALGHLDIALISHDDHKDNLDHRGRQVALEAGAVISTHPAARRMGGVARGLSAGESLTLGELTIHAVEAVHGPADGERDSRGFVNCEVIGFVLQAHATQMFLSGDTTSLEAVRAVVERFGPMDYAVLHAGRASVPAKFAGRPLSMTAGQAATAARVLSAQRVIVAHQTQWAHFTQGPAHTREAFETAGLGSVLAPSEPGVWGSLI
ncbi:MBL fold metallo-hydrolase [Actinomyces faecalis]|uniref:MBL fold metallo-hydrolase n=1 Tax=Actinomyces faecalis TaxID=2722820 RepID=UPI0015548824|nr:MBL fold metallo-hydrolase [Actinomyces faecalis]